MLRKTLLTAAVALLAISVAGTGHAINKTKTLMQVPEDMERDPGPWGATDYCTLSYYNFCAGWIYVWSPWSASDVIGVDIDPNRPGVDPNGQPLGCPPKAEECASVAGVWFQMRNAFPSYGYTASVHCYKHGEQPGHLGKPTFWGQPQEWLEGWNFVDLNNCHIRGGGVIAIHFENPGPLSPATDARTLACTNGCFDAGHTPWPCPGVGYSYYYGTIATGNFSGSPIYSTGVNSSYCDWLMDVIVCCMGPTAVEPSSWGSIKTMYE
jgi:hypothetical protein